MAVSRRALPSSVVVVAIAALACPVAASAASTAAGDFDGDGCSDLAIGVPNEAIKKRSGAVNVLYQQGGGGASCVGGRFLGAQDDDFFHPGMASVPGAADANEHFGAVLASGDFDGDGLGDLAVGSPNDNDDQRRTDFGPGSITVLYGGAEGLVTTGAAHFDQDELGVTGAAEEGDSFGSALAAGDFNGDKLDDLAIGVRGENRGAGAVNVIYGSAPNGLDAAADRLLSQNSSGVHGTSEPDDLFAFALASGDFDDDSRDDLAVGVPGEKVAGRVSAGMVHVLRGADGGLTGAGSIRLLQGTDGLRGNMEARDDFGTALATGDLDSNPSDDLAISAVGENGRAGAVSVVYGTAGGLTGAGDDLYTQDTAGIKGQAQAWDQFGFPLAVGRFDGAPAEDLAVGVTGDNNGGGAVATILGSPTGLTFKDQLFDQDTGGISESVQPSDMFGISLAAGTGELMVGVEGENVSISSTDQGAILDGGAVHVLDSGAAGIVLSDDEFITQDARGVNDDIEARDGFGAALASGK